MGPAGLRVRGDLVTEIAERTAPMSRRRFAIAADGSITGGDETSDQLGAALRYVCRMAGQIETLLGVGRLHWLTTLSGTTVTARVGRSGAGDMTVTAEVERRETRAPTHLATPDADGAHAAMRQCLKRVRNGLDADWCAVITSDQRIVGALLPEPGSPLGDVGAVLSEVGLRALAVLGALDVPYRETGVLLDYRRGSLMVVAVDGDVLFAFADKFDPTIASRIIHEVRAVLAPHDLSLLWAAQ